MGREPEAAIVDSRLQLDHRRVKAPGIGDAQRDPGARHRIERPFGAFDVEGERLFHEDVLAGGGSALDLRPVLAVRGGEDDRVDRRIGEDPPEIVVISDAVLGAKRLGGGAGAAVTGGEAKLGALVLDRIDQGAAPAAEPDDRGADHLRAASMSRTPSSAT